MTAYDIKMGVFVAAMFGEKPEWYADVYGEYISLRQNKNSKYLLDLIKDIAHLQTQHDVVEMTLNALELLLLSNRTSPELVKELKLQGNRGQFDISIRSRYINDLAAARSRNKRIRESIRRKEKELKEYQQRHASGELKREDFDDWNVELSRFTGFRIDMDALSVSEWCRYMNKFDAYCEVQNADKPENNLIYGNR